MEDIKKFCVVSCPISTRSGYGARSRDFVRALIEARPEWDIHILSQRWGNTPMDALVPGEDDDLLRFKSQYRMNLMLWVIIILV